MGYVPVKTRVGNQLYMFAGIVAHNLTRELQMRLNPRARPYDRETRRPVVLSRGRDPSPYPHSTRRAHHSPRRQADSVDEQQRKTRRRAASCSRSSERWCLSHNNIPCFMHQSGLREAIRKNPDLGNIMAADRCKSGYQEFVIDEMISTCVFESLVEPPLLAGSRRVQELRDPLMFFVKFII